MKYRRFGRTGWDVSEIGYGMWGMAGWTGSDDAQSLDALQQSVNLGCNFFDTAWAYGEGHSERLLGRLINANPDKTLYAATKIPPKNRKWPPRKGSPVDEVFPSAYIQEYTEKSLTNLDRPHIDLLQFHVWEDAWAEDDRWQRAMDDLKRNLMSILTRIAPGRHREDSVKVFALDDGEPPEDAPTLERPKKAEDEGY